MTRGRSGSVETLRHKDKRRKHPTAELEAVMDERVEFLSGPGERGTLRAVREQA